MEGYQMQLRYPISANRYWRNFRGRMVRSAEANAYRRHVADVASQIDVEVMASQVEVEIELLPKLTLSGAASGVILDLDNALKVALDALQGVAYTNDKQVRRIAAQYGEPVKNGGLRVRVRAM